MHHVYRLFDVDGRLLYVGATHDVEKRVAAHRSSSPFGWRIASVTSEAHADKAAALEAERAAIRTEAPLFNVMGRMGDRSGWTLAHYRAFIAACEPRAGSHVVRRRIDRMRAEAIARFGEVAA